MILTVKNFDGLVIAYVESTKVNDKGKKDKNGIYIRIENLWIHVEYTKTYVLEELVHKLNIHPLHRDCIGVYWVTLKNKDGNKIIDDTYTEVASKKISKLYKKDEIANKIIGEYTCSNNSFN